jgi:hypothetical protein
VKGPAFRRAIIVTIGEGRIDAELEDDFHRFGVTLHHDGAVVTEAEGRAIRYPWTTCPEAPNALAALAGSPLVADPTFLYRHTDPRAQCTHLFELAVVALSQAGRAPGERVFEASASDPEAGPRRAELRIDGALAAAWDLLGDVITAPAEYAGRAVNSLTSQGLSTLDPETALHMLILRRVALTARGRHFDVDAYATAAAMGRSPQCYSLQPENAVRGARVLGSHLDWPTRHTLIDALRGSTRAKPEDGLT